METDLSKDEEVTEDIEPLTEDDYKTDLKTLTNLKFEKVDWFKIKGQETPKTVEFNDVQYPYDRAFVKAVNEIYDMFSGCNSYEEARERIMSEDVLSKEKGYCVSDDITGRLYLCWAVIWGNDTTKTIYWDVRWY